MKRFYRFMEEQMARSRMRVAAHPFWDLQGPARLMAINYFLEHLALIAGCVLAALLAEHADRERRKGRIAA
jgi:hypothetical protein